MLLLTQTVSSIFLVLGLAAGAQAQETRTMKPGAASPPAKLEDLAWLHGHWEGPGITGPATEVYSAPAGGQIVGHFRQLRDGRIWFFEIDFRNFFSTRGVLTFPLVAVEHDAWYFDGLTIKRDGPDGMIGAVRIGNKDGSSREAVFKYRRVK